MKIFDFNIHLPCGTEDLDSRWLDETTMSGSSFEKCFIGYKDELKNNCIGGNIMILNSSLKKEEVSLLKETIFNAWDTTSLTVMVDPRDKNWKHRIVELHEVGVKGIKFHCYIQKITLDDIATCVEIASEAQSLNMLIMIDASYGSLGMYQYDNLRLASAIASKVSKTPIILLHSGGARCLEAMLLAEATRNVYLETSYTLPYYIGSSIERDLAFTYKKIGVDRVLYGSDFPYVGFDESEKSFIGFMEKWNFTSSQIDMIAMQNGLRITNLHV